MRDRTHAVPSGVERASRFGGRPRLRAQIFAATLHVAVGVGEVVAAAEYKVTNDNGSNRCRAAPRGRAFPDAADVNDSQHATGAAARTCPTADKGDNVVFTETLPGDLAPYFQPPPEYSGKSDGRTSPLLFADGRPVTTPAEWAERRREIRQQWMTLMGEWPALLKAPRLERIASVSREGIEQVTVRVEVAADVFQTGLLLIPEENGPLPAVFVPYYNAETSAGLAQDPLRDFGFQLAKRGFVALCLGSPGGDARKPDTGTARCQPLSYLAYIGANAHTILSRLPNVDFRRIGVVGHSYGGKWAMFSACLYDKYACGAWSDPGIVFDEQRQSINYWEPWYLGREAGAERKPGLVTDENPRTGAYARMREEGRDLHELQALMAPRPFLVSGGSEDTIARWATLTHFVAVNELLGHRGTRVAMTNRPKHDPTPESNETIYRFFEYFLKAK